MVDGAQFLMATSTISAICSSGVTEQVFCVFDITRIPAHLSSFSKSQLSWLENIQACLGKPGPGFFVYPVFHHCKLSSELPISKLELR